MKKTLALVLAAVMLLSLLSACKSSADETPTVDPAETEQTTTPEETTPEEETPEEPQPSQEELDQAAADEVAAMIDAIYVQERTDAMYLCQQLLSILSGNALQPDTVESSSVQLVIHELVHT